MDLSVQLYSIRDEVGADLPAALARLAGIGFRRVEPFDLTGDPDGLRAALDASGLTAPSAHARLGEDADLDRIFTAAATVGVRTVIHPFTAPERWTSADGVDAVADEVGRAVERASGYGLRIGYHNHDWELTAMPDGRVALEYFADQLGPDVILELDTYWAAVGGQDVPELLGRLGDRVIALHLKDGPLTGVTADQLPLGSGDLPAAEILAAATALEVPVIEFDQYAGDIFQGVAAAYEYATGTLGFAR